MRSVLVPVEYLFRSFPRELATPYRIGMANGMHQLVGFINAHNGRTNCYCSVHSFSRLRAPGKPDFQTARIEFVPMDFDGVRAGVADAFRLHNALLDKGIEHAATFSGGGCHVFIRATPDAVQKPAAALNGAQTWLERTVLSGAAPSIDKASFFGDPARVIRVPNTVNRNKGGRFDVPLTARAFEELAAAVELDPEGAAAAVASRPLELTLEEFVQAGEPLDVSKWDTSECLPARGRWSDLDIGEFTTDSADTGVEVVVANPLIARLAHANANNDERGRILIELFEEGYSLGEALRFMRKTLSPEKYRHMVYNERQAQRLWERFMR